MTFPHPQTCQEHDGNEDEAGWEGVLRNLVKWTVDVAEDRDAEDQVYPAKDRATDASVRDMCRLGHNDTPFISCELGHGRDSLGGELALHGVTILDSSSVAKVAIQYRTVLRIRR